MGNPIRFPWRRLFPVAGSSLFPADSVGDLAGSIYILRMAAGGISKWRLPWNLSHCAMKDTMNHVLLNFLTARDPQDLSSDFNSKVCVSNLRSL